MRVAVGLAVALVLTGPALAQNPMETQRCVWRCLSEFGPNTNPAYHHCVAQRCTPAPAASPMSPWAFIDPLLAQVLDVRPGDPTSPWLFPNHADPTQATFALGVHYPPNRVGGNSFGISVGLFARTAEGWVYRAPVNRIFGQDPRDPVFLDGRMELTTTTLGPTDPRCCPSVPVRWSVDLATGAAAPLR